jgi:hypothetical protein
MVDAGDRFRTLLVARGELHVSLRAGDIDALVDAIDLMVDGVRKAYAREEDRPGFAETLEAHVGDLEGLRRKLVASFRQRGSIWSPAVSEASLLRSVLSDITGYQRGDLTPGLRELREILSVRSS